MAQTRTLKAHSCMMNVTTMSATNEISDSGTLHAVHVAPQVPARTCVLVQFQSNLRDTTQMSPCSHSGWLMYALICSAKVQLLYRQFARSSPHGVTRDCVFGHRHDSSNGEHHSVMQSVFVFGPLVSTLLVAVKVREHYTYTADWHITQRRKIHDRHTQLAVASKNIRTRRKKNRRWRLSGWGRPNGPSKDNNISVQSKADLHPFTEVPQHSNGRGKPQSPTHMARPTKNG